jgi:hypothetical protein
MHIRTLQQTALVVCWLPLQFAEDIEQLRLSQPVI